MKNTWNDFVKPIVVLGVICLVTSLLLAVTNNVTAPHHRGKRRQNGKRHAAGSAAVGRHLYGGGAGNPYRGRDGHL